MKHIIKVQRVPAEEPTRPWTRPQCESNVLPPTTYWRSRTGRDDRCTFKAWYEVNGLKLCHRHAGITVLELLAGGHYEPRKRT